MSKGWENNKLIKTIEDLEKVDDAGVL